MKTAKRLDDFEAYLGTAMNLILTKMKEEGKDVINLGLGDPDVFPPEGQRKVLADACMDRESHHYPSFYSPMPLKQAIAGWYKHRYNVACDPETEVLPLIGSAEGLFHIHTCLLDVGDTALVPDHYSLCGAPSFRAPILVLIACVFPQSNRKLPAL